ncbi:Protein T05B9.2, partial [Aphelenchoides avenae]
MSSDPSLQSKPLRTLPVGVVRHRLLATAVSALILCVNSVSSMPLGMEQRSGRCYAFSPGTTIPGADYRRDYGLTRKECAKVCKHDVCCMAFEWVQETCTLKSRSLNGTVEAKPGAFFGLCLDY